MLQVASHDDNAALAAKLVQARSGLLEVYADLPKEFWQCERFPYAAVVNPPLWEWTHVAWFQEYWCLRHDFTLDAPVRSSLLHGADEWVDSRKVPHAIRWHPGYPAKQAVEDYMRRSLELTLDALSLATSDRLYPFRLALYHEAMHVEALLMTLRTLGLPLPSGAAPIDGAGGAIHASRSACTAEHMDISIAGGRHPIGSRQDSLHFVFDNERTAYALELDGFSISRRPVSRAEFRDFALLAYETESAWSSAGWAWNRSSAGRLRFWLAELTDCPEDPVEGVSAYEAEAFCKAAGRRLPSEFEWEVAASMCAIETTGRVWEWTSSNFLPYAGFSADPYCEYSQPWFGDHRVLKGGSWATHPDLKRPAFRNFYLPGRSDVFAGFRTCAL